MSTKELFIYSFHHSLLKIVGSPHGKYLKIPKVGVFNYYLRCLLSCVLQKSNGNSINKLILSLECLLQQHTHTAESNNTNYQLIQSYNSQRKKKVLKPKHYHLYCSLEIRRRMSSNEVKWFDLIIFLPAIVIIIFWRKSFLIPVKSRIAGNSVMF